MNFKERMLTAMNHEEPDRVPVMGLIMDPATVDQVLGKNPTNVVKFLDKPVVGRAVQKLLDSNWFWDRMYFKNFSGALESATRLGFDANWAIYAFMQIYKGATNQ